MTEYGSFCPVSKAAEVLCERWALLVVRELIPRRARFTELRRGLPGCPPATLSKRLKQLEQAGAVDRIESGGTVWYELTEAGVELMPIVLALGTWGQRWVRSTYPDDELDPDELLWDVRRHLDPAGLGIDPCVVRLDLELPEQRRASYWIVVDKGTVDVCDVEPRREVTVTVATHLRTLIMIWMGDLIFADAVHRDLLHTTGPRAVVRRLPAWLGPNPLLGVIPPARAVALDPGGR